MKKTIYILVAMFLVANILLGDLNTFAVQKPAFVQKAASSKQTMQAVWIATVENMDFPRTKDNMEAQKKEFIANLDKLKEIGINTVMVQVRPKSDALYKSDINPWSDVLTGKQGKDPGYNPMAFMIEETHKRGMAFHAWLNPYRITKTGTKLSALTKNHLARLNPDWVINYQNALYFNPEKVGVRNHIAETVKEIVSEYDVDGIVFDDYFYPSNYPRPKGEGKDGAIANSRRENVNAMVSQVSATIKNTKSTVLFGISPSGIWKNKKSDPTGSKTTGNESYYSVCADTRTWIKNGWIDYVSPQIYWETGNKAADYETLVAWWSKEVKGTNVKLYISQGLYREVVAKQIAVQIGINKKYPEVTGSIYFNLTNLLANSGGCKAKIRDLNKALSK